MSTEPLRALARARLPALLRREGFLAVALTGSAARGDAEPGSDLDLWCLARGSLRHHRRELRWSGVDVTLLVDGQRNAGTLESLSQCETDDLLVLHDPRGLFPPLQRRARELRPRLNQLLMRATARALNAELREGARGSALNRVPPLREAALRVASIWAFRHYGYRTPRWRTLVRILPPKARALLAEILDVPPTRSAKRALTHARRAARALGSPLPKTALARLHAAQWTEATLLTRRHLERDVLGPLLQTQGCWEVTQLEQPSLLRALELLHRTTRTNADGLMRDVQRLALALDVSCP